MSYEIVVHQYTDSFSGHINYELKQNGESLGFFGAYNSGIGGWEGFSGGVKNETLASLSRIHNSPDSHTAISATVSESSFNQVKSFLSDKVSQTLAGNGDYDLFGGNCVDLGYALLAEVGSDRPMTDFLVETNSFAYMYADVIDFWEQNDWYKLINFNEETADENYFFYNLHEVTDQYLSEREGTPNLYQYSELLSVIITLGFDGVSNSNLQEYTEISEENDELMCPLIIDLGGDGLSTISRTESGVRFDIDGDGELESTGWVGAEEGFLVLDLNKNGVVDGLQDLFGGPDRGDGFASLSIYDNNQDNVIDLNDSIFDQLQIWKDSDQNGVTGSNELFSLMDLGITEISLDYVDTNILDNGNFIGEVSEAEVLGVSVDVYDVYFAVGE